MCVWMMTTQERMDQRFPLELTITLNLCPWILCVLLMRMDCRFLILMDSPSICMQVISSCSGFFIVISKGPSPCRARAPDLITRSRAKLSYDLKLTNSNSPSSTFWSEYQWCLRLGTAISLVRHTLRSPAMQLVQLRQTIPQQPDLRGYIPCWELLITESSISFQLFLSLAVDQVSIVGLWVMECTVSSSLFIGLKKLRKPISPYTTLFKNATGVRWRSTVQTTLASRPIPTQLENILRKDLSGRSISCWSLISQMVPQGKVLTSTSHMSQWPIVAFIHYFTRSPKPRSWFRDTLGPLGPHPRLRLKSLPVPIGRMPITTVDKSTPASCSSDSTQGIVPSPPQITTRKATPCYRERERARVSPAAREGTSNRSKMWRRAVWLDSYLMVIWFPPRSRKAAPCPSPLLVLTKSMKWTSAFSIQLQQWGRSLKPYN